MPTGNPNRSASFADIIDGILERLNTILEHSPTDGYVRLVVHPNPDLAEYRAEEGCHVLVFPPEPRTASGRYDMHVTRPVVVALWTQCLLDAGGFDYEAMKNHLRLEERVVDAVVSGHPLFSTDNDFGGGAVNIRWKPGGNEIARRVRSDTGLVGSALAFDVTYAQPFTVTTE